jgi:hypothetical protein
MKTCSMQLDYTGEALATKCIISLNDFTNLMGYLYLPTADKTARVATVFKTIVLNANLPMLIQTDTAGQHDLRVTSTLKTVMSRKAQG